MDIETKLELIKQQPTEEIITEVDLRQLLETNDHPKHYIGFEISGMLHLGTLLISGYKIKDLVEAGCRCKIFLADWHSWINNKLGGNWDLIKKAAEYFQEGFVAFGLDEKKVKYILGTDLYHDNDKYWVNFFKISKALTLKRVQRALTILGRKEGEAIDFSQLLYPSLQVTDVFEMSILPHGGMDQRKAHVLAREVAEKLGWQKPVAVHHSLLAGLTEPVRAGYEEDVKLDLKVSSKMSKSKPWTCIFIHDSDEQIKEKLEKAWCPEKVIENNPVLELAKYIIFREKKTFEVERPAKYGGTETFNSYEELESEFKAGKIHPQDLKQNVAREIAAVVKPIRKHFEKPSYKKLLDVFKKAEVTR